LIEIFDSTTLTLFKEILKGAGRNAIDGKKKGGLKVFTKIDFLENVPNYICMKAASANETGFLKLMEMEKGSIGVMDKGFNKYSYFDLLDKSGRFFVTRKKQMLVMMYWKQELRNKDLTLSRIRLYYSNTRTRKYPGQ